jgi:ubiquinone/menaquinone biosynthesis C-methylase UbiE
MHQTLTPLIQSYPCASWMTIGDGNYGSNAFFLLQNHADVLATSLNDEPLVLAQEKGFIKDYRREDAEQISATDNSFDFLLCKESYHNFSHPPIGFYEMLRVAKQGIVLIEPQETSRVFLFDHLKILVKKGIRRDKSVFFEPSGNYIFRLNVREVEKMLIPLNYNFIAYKRFNDFYFKHYAEEKFHRFSWATNFFKFGIYFQDILCHLKLLNFGLITLIVFKKSPDEKTLELLKKNGFHIYSLIQNPYINIEK